MFVYYADLPRIFFLSLLFMQNLALHIGNMIWSSGQTGSRIWAQIPGCLVPRRLSFSCCKNGPAREEGKGKRRETLFLLLSVVPRASRSIPSHPRTLSFDHGRRKLLAPAEEAEFPAYQRATHLLNLRMRSIYRTSPQSALFFKGQFLQSANLFTPRPSSWGKGRSGDYSIWLSL